MLDDEQVGKVKMMLQHPGWVEVVHPGLMTHSNLMVKALILSPAERSGEWKQVTDDDLRARIRAVAWLLDTLRNTIVAHEHNTTLDELQRQEHTANP